MTTYPSPEEDMINAKVPDPREEAEKAVIEAARRLKEGNWHEEWCDTPPEQCRVGPPVAQGYAAVRAAYRHGVAAELEFAAGADPIHNVVSVAFRVRARLAELRRAP